MRNKYIINPLQQAKQVSGVGIEKLIPYKPATDVDGYYSSLYSGDPAKGFRLSSSYGIPIADRWLEMDIDEQTCLTIECPVIKLSRPRVINRTQIAGLDHSIKEFICEGDFDINLTFYVVSQRQLDTNWEQLKLFKRLMDLKASVPIYSALLNNVFGITKVVITEMADISPHDAYNNIYIVTMNMLGDEDYIPFEKEQ